MKRYIDDFVEDLNYRKVPLYFSLRIIAIKLLSRRVDG